MKAFLGNGSLRLANTVQLDGVRVTIVPEDSDESDRLHRLAFAAACRMEEPQPIVIMPTRNEEVILVFPAHVDPSAMSYLFGRALEACGG